MDRTINIAADGTITAVYADELAEAFTGCNMKIERASTVEHNEATQQWEVRWTDDPSGKVVFAAGTRTACINWEIEQLNKKIGAL